MGRLDREIDKLGKKRREANEGYQRDPEHQEKERKTSKQTDPSKDGFTGIGNSIKDIMKQNAAMKKAAAAKKVKKEELEIGEAKVDTVKHGTLNSPGKEKARNERKFGKVGWNQGGQSQLRKGVHWSKRGEKKVRGAKVEEQVVDEATYDNTKSPDYDKKKKALAKKHGGADKVKGHPQYESTVQSALESLNSYYTKNEKLHGSVTTKKN